MSNIVSVEEKNMQAVESALVRNDISKLSTSERITFIHSLCKSVGLNPLTKPISIINLQGREVPYATKDCSEQLRKIHGVSTQIISKGVVGDMYEVHIKARDKHGKEDEDFAVIPLGNAKGNDLANLMMKCVTKAKRRVTLSICGLGILDESELDTIRNVKTAHNPQIENPFKKNEETINLLTTPEELIIDSAPDLGEFVCKVGKKYNGKKLSEIDIFDLNNFVENTKKWFDEENKIPSAAWVEFFEIAETYLSSREIKQNEPGDA